MAENKNILVVDDDSGIGEMLKTLLEIYDYSATVTEQPDKTEALIKEHDVDLVMLDMLISGVNGTDVCTRLKSNEETKHIPILMMSALHNAGKKCKEAGAEAFISKPFEMEDLLREIKKLTGEEH